MTPDADETWKPIPGYEGFYEISDIGCVRSIERRTPQADYMRRFPSRILRPGTRADGYRNVTLSKCGVPKTFLVHRLICMAFHGPQPEWASCIRHLDGDRSNNTVANLIYGTHSENAADTIAHGNNPQKAKTHCPKGHPYSGGNVRVGRKKKKDGTYGYARTCRTCHNESSKRHRVPIPRRVVTHCPQGHEYTLENTYQQKTRAGGLTKLCKACSYAGHKRWRQGKRAAKKAA